MFMPYKDLNKRRECHRIWQKKWLALNKEIQAARDSKSYLKHKEVRLAQGKIWHLKNKERTRAQQRKYWAEKYHSDVSFRLAACFRDRILKVLQGKNKSKSSLQLLGCSIGELKNHLQNKF